MIFKFSFLLSVSLLSMVSWADLIEEDIRPLVQRAKDPTSQKLLMAWIPSHAFAQEQDSEIREQWKNYRIMDQSLTNAGDRFDSSAIGPLIILGQSLIDPANGRKHLRAFLANGVVTHSLKTIIQRRRPNGDNLRSMPSGHSSTAFASATVMAYSYGVKAGLIAYPLATIVALSRVSSDVHWFSDIVAGAYLGIWMGRAASYDLDQHQSQTTRWMVVPVVESRWSGLEFSFLF